MGLIFDITRPKFGVFAVLIGLLGFCANVYAKPLTVEDIRKAKKIGIMPGTFDPVTQGHIAAAKAAVDQGGLDMVILVPQENPHKNPISRAQRLKLIDFAALDLEKVTYAKDGELYPVFEGSKMWTIVRKIRKINPDAEIDLVAAADFASNPVTTFLFKYAVMPDRWVILSRSGYENAALSRTVMRSPHDYIEMPPLDVSSSKAKKYLLAHPELYSGSEGVSVPGLEPEVQKYILSNDLYRFEPKPDCAQYLLSLVWKK
jgi:nicotinate-nucleotide adenylyltransferase